MQNDIVSENPQSTVVAQYERTTPRAEAYQSEAELEQGMIAQLQRQGYEYAHIHHEDELIQNLRLQLEKLNDFHFPTTSGSVFQGGNRQRGQGYC